MIEISESFTVVLWEEYSHLALKETKLKIGVKG